MVIYLGAGCDGDATQLLLQCSLLVRLRGAKRGLHELNLRRVIPRALMHFREWETLSCFQNDQSDMLLVEVKAYEFPTRIRLPIGVWERVVPKTNVMKLRRFPEKFMQKAQFARRCAGGQFLLPEFRPKPPEPPVSVRPSLTVVLERNS
jgi:hypothetical protein